MPRTGRPTPVIELSDTERETLISAMMTPVIQASSSVRLPPTGAPPRLPARPPDRTDGSSLRRQHLSHSHHLSNFTHHRPQTDPSRKGRTPTPIVISVVKEYKC
jgi:hypothetical protein